MAMLICVLGTSLKFPVVHIVIHYTPFPSSKFLGITLFLPTPNFCLSRIFLVTVLLQLAKYSYTFLFVIFLQAGITTLFYSLLLYSVNYHSLGVHLRPVCQVNLTQ